MKAYRIFWREYMNSSNNGSLVVYSDNMIDAIKDWELAKSSIQVIYQICEEL